MLLSKAIEIFLEGVKNERTRDNYRKFLAMFLNYVGNKKIAKVCQKDCTLFEKYLQEKNSSYDHLGMSAVRSFFKYMARLEISCLAPEKVFIPKQKINPQHCIKDISKILNSFKEREYEQRDKCMFHSLYSTGCRSIELIQMKVSQIDWDNSSIEIIGKGDKPRTVYFTESCLKDIKHYLKIRKLKTDYLFPAKGKDKPMALSAVRMVFWRLSKQFGHLSSHMLRRSFATELYRQSNDILKVSKLLGHTHITTTQKYTIVEDEELKDFHSKNLGKNHEIVFEKKLAGRCIIKLSGWVAEGHSKRAVEKAIKKAINEVL